MDWKERTREKDGGISMKKNEFEKEINLLDMFWAICLKWRSIILISVLVTIIVGCYSYVSIKQQYSQTQETEVELSDEEMSEVSKYITIENNYESQKQYIVDSPLMNLDANGYYDGNLQYWIKMEGDNAEGMRDAIVKMYQAALKKDSFYEKVGECLNGQYEEVYYTEIVDTEGMIDKNVYQIIQDNSEEKGIITVHIRLMEEENVEKILQLVQQEFASVSTSVSATLGAHELIVLANEVSFISSDELFAYQKSNITELRDNATSLAAAKKDLSDNQNKYLELREKEKVEAAAHSSVEEEESINIYAYVIKQMVFAWIIIVVVIVLLYALRYLFNSSVRVEDSMEHLYGITTLAKVQAKEVKKYNLIDGLILKARHANVEIVDIRKAASMLTSSIRIACKKEEKAKVLFTSHGRTQEEKKIVELVKKELSKDGIEVSLGGSLHKDCKSLEEGFETSMLILMENAGETKYKTIEKELQLCNSYGMTVVGMVIIS